MKIIDPIFNNIDMKFYYLQQQLSILLSLKLSHMNLLTFMIVLMSGIVTSLNPCLLSILPLCISYLYGNNGNIKLLNKLMFLVGTISSLIGMIFVTSIISHQYYSLINKIPIFSSLFTIFIGLNLLQIIKIYNFLPYLNNFSPFFKIQLFQNYIIGLVLGLSATPCSTPIVIIILVWLLHAKYSLLGYIYLFVYSLGYILPVIICINWVLSNNQILNITKSWDYLVPLSGSCILGLGIFAFLEKVFI